MISRNEVASALRAYVREAAEAPRPPAAVRAREGAEGVSLSPQAADVARWLQALRSLPDVRQDRVETVRQRLEAGDYPPPAAAVAEKILARWLANR